MSGKPNVVASRRPRGAEGENGQPRLEAAALSAMVESAMIALLAVEVPGARKQPAT